MNSKSDSRKEYLRPIKLAIFFSVLAEAIIFVVWGLILYPEGNLLHKFLWTIVFCGLGMGATTGAFISLFVVGRWNGVKAILATAAISTVLLGFLCNLLCYKLDMHFDYFGGPETPELFIWNGLVMAFIAGALVGYLLFTNAGKNILDKIGI